MNSHLLLDVALYLAAAIVLVPIARRVGLGAVMGYLLAGMAIGPWGFGWITNVENILDFSEFGVVLLMFVIGLELSPRRLWALRGPVLGGGSLQVGSIAAVLSYAAWLLGCRWQTAVIIGAGLCLSSTAIALTSFNERRLTKTPAGETGFSILLFQDMAAIPIIAAIPLLAAQGGHQGGSGWMLLRAAGVFVALVLCGRFLINPLLRQMAKSGLREIFTAFALLLVIASGMLMQWVGASMALGAFLAGLLLADSEYRHALEADLEPFKGLLLGLFFMAVGMSVDFGVLMLHPWRVIALTLAFVAIKMIMMTVLGWLLKIPASQRFLFAALLAQGGEFAFVIFGAATDPGLLDHDSAAMLTVIVALSMAMTPLLLLGHDGWLRLRGSSAQNTREPDVIDGADGPVIIAGFGRFGQIAGRLLHASGVHPTVLDYDADQIDFLREFGFKVYYGDATRLDLLQQAGIAEARLLIVAIDDPENSTRLIKEVRKHYPQLPIAARVRNVSHYFDVVDLNVNAIERETFESALALGRTSLELLGTLPQDARRAADAFRSHNNQTLQDMLPHRGDRKKILSLAKRARQELSENFAHDREERNAATDVQPDTTPALK